MLGYFTSKFDSFRSSPTLRNLLGTGRNAVDFAEFADSRKVVLINLARGEIGAVNARLLGYLFLSRMWADLLRRGPSTAPLSVYVDEAQSFPVGPLPAMIAEGRKFALRLFLAHQFTAQLREEMRVALAGTVGSAIVFRCGEGDAEIAAAAHTGPSLSAADLRRLPSFEAACAVLADGEPQPPFTLLIEPPPGTRDWKAAERHRTRAREQLAVSRHDIEGELTERWQDGRQTPPPADTAREPPDPEDLDEMLRSLAARRAGDSDDD